MAKCVRFNSTLSIWLPPWIAVHFEQIIIYLNVKFSRNEQLTVVQSVKLGEICWKFKIFNNIAFKMSKRYGPMLRCAWMKQFVRAPKTFQIENSKLRARIEQQPGVIATRWRCDSRFHNAIYSRFSFARGAENHINFVDVMKTWLKQPKQKYNMI